MNPPSLDMYISRLAPLLSLLPPPTPHQNPQQNVTAYLYPYNTAIPTAICHDLREGQCCGASDPHTYHRVEYTGLTAQDTAIGWTVRSQPKFGWCGDIVEATAMGGSSPDLLAEEDEERRAQGLTVPSVPTTISGEELSGANRTIMIGTFGRITAVSWESLREREHHEEDQRKGIWSMVWRGKMRIGLRKSEKVMAPRPWERPVNYT